MATQAANVVKGVRTMSHGPMETASPFLFLVYHKDHYPAGDDKMQVPANLGVGNGMHFDPNAPWRFYHGDKVPGFPKHPHRGFETITATIEGIIDHSDSKGNAGRYGQGDLQWMHAGEGIVHGENFPLIHSDRPNPTRFFQIWLNSHSSKKMTPPDFLMHWAHEVKTWQDEAEAVKATIWVGELNGVATDCPAPSDSWAFDKANDVGVFHLTFKAGSELTVQPAKNPKAQRYLYFIEGSKAEVGGRSVSRANPVTLIELDATKPALIKAGDGPCEFLILQGAPIDEPVAQHGPFVMNTQQEIRQAFFDYQRTEFGGWPWSEDAVIFPRTRGRFALLNGVESAPPEPKIV